MILNDAFSIQPQTGRFARAPNSTSHPVRMSSWASGGGGVSPKGEMRRQLRTPAENVSPTTRDLSRGRPPRAEEWVWPPLLPCVRQCAIAEEAVYGMPRLERPLTLARATPASAHRAEICALLKRQAPEFVWPTAATPPFKKRVRSCKGGLPNSVGMLVGYDTRDKSSGEASATPGPAAARPWPS